MEKRVYSVADIQAILGLSQSKAYAFVNSCYKNQDKFRILKVGSEFKIPIESFEKWLNGD